MSFNIDKNGAFISDDVVHAYCPKLSEFLTTKLKGESVIDLGCGDGKYLKDFKEKGWNVKGYDGNPYTPQLTNNLGEMLDLSQVQKVEEVDWVVSFEVGEHIPKNCENNFIDNLCNHAKKGIVLSWAVPGQPGEGHINCQENEYIIEKMYEKNFMCDYVKTNELRDFTPVDWFKTNLLIFYRVDQMIK